MNVMGYVPLGTLEEKANQLGPRNDTSTALFSEERLPILHAIILIILWLLMLSLCAFLVIDVDFAGDEYENEQQEYEVENNV